MVVILSSGRAYIDLETIKHCMMHIALRGIQVSRQLPADRTRVFLKLCARKGLRPFVSNTSLLNDGTQRRGGKEAGFQ